jgi:hypothetical protein
VAALGGQGEGDRERDQGQGREPGHPDPPLGLPALGEGDHELGDPVDQAGLGGPGGGRERDPRRGPLGGRLDVGRGGGAGGRASHGGRERAGRLDLDRRVPVGLGPGRGGRVQAGKAESRAEGGGLVRSLQQRPGGVRRGLRAGLATVGEHDQLAPVAVADLGQGGVGAVAGQVEHDRVGVDEPVAVGRLTHPGEPG